MVAFNTQAVNDGAIYDGPTEVYVDNTFIGATTGGVEFVLDTEFGEKTADQTSLLLGSYMKKQRGHLRFDLEELSLSNLALIFATPAGAGGGSKSITPTHTVSFVGNGPNGATRTFTIFKGRFSGNTSGKHDLGSTVAFTVEIFMEADQNQLDGQQYFTVVDA